MEEVEKFDEDESAGLHNKPKQAQNSGLFRPYVVLLKGNKHYRNIWLSSVVSMIGDWLNELACVAVLSKISSSGFLLGALLIAREVPQFVMAPFAGVIVDSFDRKRIMIVSHLARAILVLGYLLVNYYQLLWLMYLLAALQFTLSAFFAPAFRCCIPVVVAPEQLLTANVLDGITWSSLLTVGAALGGFVTYGLGISANFIIDSCSFLLSALLISTLPPMKPPKENATNETTTETETETKSGLKMYFEGLSYLLKHRYILVLSLAKACGTLVWGGLELVVVKFALTEFQILGSGSLSLSILYMSTGIGVGFSPLLTKWLFAETDKNNRRMIIFGFFALCSGGALMAGAFHFSVLFFLNIWRTFGSGLIWIYSEFIIQAAVPGHMLGRTTSFEFSALTFTAICSRLLFGFLYDVLELNLYYICLIYGLMGFIELVFWAVFLEKSKPGSGSIKLEEEEMNLIENEEEKQKEEEIVPSE